MNKLLIITGGSRGIGEQTILTFLEKGWRVLNISRSDSNIPGIKHYRLDLSKVDEVEASAKDLQQFIGEKSIISLVHNAGFYERDSVDSVALNVIQATMTVNIISPMLLNKIIIPYMLPSSSIIYIGSTLAQKAVPNSASYSVSKHAIKGLMKATCQDLAGKDIQTCCVNPGLVDTALLRSTMNDETMNHLINNKVMGKRLINPAEIANIIYFCATSTALNGAIIDANLGEKEA